VAREFIGLLGSAAATWPLTARAQESQQPTVEFLGTDRISLEFGTCCCAIEVGSPRIRCTANVAIVAARPTNAHFGRGAK
jgi:hypothetical protein